MNKSKRQWKPIDGFGGRYEISNFGEFRSSYGGTVKFKKTNTNKHFSKHRDQIGLVYKKKRGTFYVDRMVYHYFVKPLKKEDCISLIDENATHKHHVSNIKIVRVLRIKSDREMELLKEIEKLKMMEES